MTIVHPQKTMIAGDEWQIHGSLFDRQRPRMPIPLVGATIEWTLRNSAGADVISPDQVAINIDPDQVVNAGDFTIIVSSTVTGSLGVGKYSDQLRLMTATIPRETMWQGVIIVTK